MDRKWSSGPVKRLAAVVLGAFIVITTVAHLSRRSAADVLPYDYTRDGGRSVPSRFGKGLAALHGLADNVFVYRGPQGDWYAPPREVVGSPSPLVRQTEKKREIDISSEALPLEAPLSVRLDHWAASPGGRGPGLHLGLDGDVHEEMEMGAFNAVNREACASVGHQLNTHMPQYAAHVWGTMNRTSVWQTRMQLIEWMRKEVVERNRTAEWGEGRG